MLPSSSLKDLGWWTSHYLEIAGDLPDGKENVAKHDMAGTQHPTQISLAKAEFNEVGKYNPSPGKEVEFGEW